MTSIYPAFDWKEIARLAHVSRIMDELEENELTPRGLVTYQFSARGHELGQLLAAQMMGQAYDGASVFYRSRPFMLGVGLTAEEALAADMARANSPSEGRDVGVVFNLPRRDRCTVLPMAGDVGSQYTPGVGWAQMIRYRVEELGESEADGSICVIFGGDGSVATNGFWSALTIATTLELPVLFIIEDNDYAISVKGPAQTPGGNIAANLASFQSLTIWDGSGTRPAEAAPMMVAAFEHVRTGKGAGLLRLQVPRLSGHSSVDNQAYKTAAELEAEWVEDPISHLESYLVPALLSNGEWQELRREAEDIVDKARHAAEAHPEPDPESVSHFVFADAAQPQQAGGLLGDGIALPTGSSTPNPPDRRRVNFIEAVRLTLESELARNPRCLIFGEDVGLKGGVHAATLGLQKEFGEGRVFDTSLSEEGIIGRAVGMALGGLLPVPEIQFRKYADPATEQLHNCGTIRWRSHNRFAAPLVVRMPGGFRKVGDPWHSVNDEVHFAHSVGWKVAFPSNAEDAVGLLRAALWGNNPVIFFEHRAVLDSGWARRPYPGDEYVLPFGKARVVQEGELLTVVSWGAMVERCVLAADDLGGSIEIIDLRTIQPWDRETVLESVRKTAKLLVVHEDIEFGGFGAEVVAHVINEAFLDMDGPPQRLGAPQVLTPFSTTLMAAMIPTVEQIRDKMDWLLRY